MESIQSPRWWVVALAAVGLASAAWADSATDTFNSVFGQEVQRVKATRGFEDDEKLAADLVTAARKPSTEPALVEVLCNAALDLADDSPSGFPTAVRAMQTLAERVPQKAAECNEKILSIRRRQYGAARTAAEREAAGKGFIEILQTIGQAKALAHNYSEALKLARQAITVATNISSPALAELQAWVRKLTALEQASRQAALMEARLKDNPKDEFARRRLMELHLVEMDDPAGAAKFLDQDSDERLRTYLPLAGKDTSDLAPQACLELAEWYQTFGDKASTAGRVVVLSRAKTYYTEFLAKYDKEDMLSTKAKITLEKVDAELKKLDASPPIQTKWVDLLKLIDPAKHTVLGRWWKRGDHLGIRSRGYSRISVPMMPKGDYELKAEFSRTGGDNDVNFILPVGSGGVVLMLSSSNGAASGLSAINGQYCERNETRTSGALANDTPHSLYVKATTRGDQAQISATLDGKRLVDWRGPVTALSISGNWRLSNPAALGLGADDGNSLSFTSLQLRMLSGKAEPITVAETPQQNDNQNQQNQDPRRNDPRRQDPRRRRPPGG